MGDTRFNSCSEAQIGLAGKRGLLVVWGLTDSLFRWSNSDPSAPRQWARRVARLYERTQMQVDYVIVGAGSAGCVLAVRGP